MPLILALDQAPSGSGFGYGDGSGPPNHGYREFSDYGGNESALMDHVFDWVVTFGKSIGAEIVYTEQITPRKGKIVPGRGGKLRIQSELDTNVLHKQYAVYCAVAFACGKRGLGVPHLEALISDWRKRFLGTTAGKTDSLKAMAMAECATRNWYPANHHAAEALGIWDWAMQHHDPVYRHRTNPDHRRAQSRREAERIG